MSDNQDKNDIQFQIECVTQDLIEMLMESKGISMEKAMDLIYNSLTYKKLENPKTGLYYQSGVYVFDYLINELDAA